MNPELEMTRHKEFFRLKEDFKAQLWDRVECRDSYESFRAVLIDAMNASFKLGEGR